MENPRPTSPASTWKLQRPDSERRLFVRFALVVAVFVTTSLILLFLTFTGLEVLSTARAFVTGEALWTKAQKDVVYHLRKYVHSEAPEDWQSHRQALAVLQAARRARLALESPEPGVEAAVEGLRASGNHPADIPGMIRLFRWLDVFEPFARAIRSWEAAERRVAELEGLAYRLRSELSRPDSEPKQERLDLLLGELDRVNRELTELEASFSAHIGRGSRQLKWRLQVLITVVTTALLAAGIGLAGWLARYARSFSKALSESERRFRALAESSAVGIWHVTPEGQTLYVNPAMLEMLEVDDPREMEGMSYHPFISSASLETVERERSKRLVGQASTYEAELLGRRGGKRSVLISGAPIVDDAGQLEGTTGTFIDISDRKQIEDQLEHQAHHDPLTDLPNRSLFMQRLNWALREARRDDSLIAVLFLDLDRFKVINDSLGHPTGDQVLNVLARRLVRCVRDRDLVARLGGDEFAVLLDHQTSRQGAINTARRVADAIEDTVDVAGTRLRLTASLGIALSRSSHEEAEDLLRDADIAMYVAKRKGGGQHHVFDPLEDARETFQLHFENALWQAVDNGEMSLLYQPVVSLPEGRLAGVEALVRWNRPEGEPIAPDEFIPVAEETGSIVPIGHWVLDQACRHMAECNARWPEHHLWLSVNLSGRQVRRPELRDELARILEERGLAAEDLCLELTESLLTQVPEHVARLKSLGPRIAIDDFGAGYSSLAALRRLSVDTLKIDRLFLAGLGSDRQDTELVRTAVQLAKALGVEVVAEGVETGHQLELLRQMGCDLAQGFHFAPPLTARDLEDLVCDDPRW